MEELQKNGYLILRGVLDPEIGRSCIQGKTVNYTKMAEFIQSNMLDKVNKELGVDLHYVKYRVSDNNNSADAGAIHRDIICQDPNAIEPISCFTCLTYLDPTVMELMPGSHRMLSMSFTEALGRVSRVKQMKMKPGDVLFFYSTLLHRGIFTEQLEHRRLIQVFDVFMDPGVLNDFYHVRGSETFSDIMIKLSKNPVAASILNAYGYINAAMGYGYLKNVPFPISYLSSEGLRERLEVVPDSWQEINKYIIIRDAPVLPEEYRDDFKFVCYNRQYIIYSLVVMVLIGIILGGGYQFAKRSKKFIGGGLSHEQCK